jgi:cytochrome c biogenesis protein CcmG, thiol:disulfide interchange protein DsbE
MSDSGFSQTSAAERQLLPPDRGSRPLWPWLLLIGVVAGVLVWRVLFSPQVNDEPVGKRSPAVGAKLSEIALEPLTGDPPPVATSALAGKVTLINFWGPWCGYCLQEFPELVEIEQHFRSQSDFQFFSVSSNSDPFDERGLAEQTAQFMKQQQATFPTYRDSRGHTHRALAAAAKLTEFGYPTTVVLDREGRIRGLWIGYRPTYIQQVRAVIEETLRGDPLLVPADKAKT